MMIIIIILVVVVLVVVVAVVVAVVAVSYTHLDVYKRQLLALRIIYLNKLFTC